MKGAVLTLNIYSGLLSGQHSLWPLPGVGSSAWRSVASTFWPCGCRGSHAIVQQLESPLGPPESTALTPGPTLNPDLSGCGCTGEAAGTAAGPAKGIAPAAETVAGSAHAMTGAGAGARPAQSAGEHHYLPATSDEPLPAVQALALDPELTAVAAHQ